MSIAEKLTAIAENEQKVYDAGVDKGRQEGYSQGEIDVWTLINDRSMGGCTFYGWKSKYIRPPFKFSLKAKWNNTTYRAFYRCEQLVAVEKEYFDFSTAIVRADKADYGHNQTFGYCASLQTIEDIGIQAAYYLYTFEGCTSLKTIEVLRVTEDCMFKSVFTNCTALENITIDGIIGQDGFNVSYSKKLTHESLMSIIGALKDFNGTGETRTITLGSDNINKLTLEEQQIAIDKGWTLV